MFFFFKQKTAYEMRISDWSSDVCSSDLEPVGDYFAGPNHILPTNGTARFSSPLSVDDFMKKSSMICYSKQALLKNGESIMTLARHEGLEIGRASCRERVCQYV